MQPPLFKLCADSLRMFTNEKYSIKLKASHAHELVAAYFGYSSKNAMLADINHPIANLNQAAYVVMVADETIDIRRENLQGLSAELPDSYTLGEPVYGTLFSDEWWASQHPTFRNLKVLAKHLVEENDVYQELFKFYRDIPVHHVVIPKPSENEVQLSVVHATKTSGGELMGHGETSIKLPRIAGHIGFSKPKFSVGQWTGGARRTLESLGVQYD